MQMRQGETANLTIPPELAYGDKGIGKFIPPDSTLNFKVELKEVKEQKWYHMLLFAFFVKDRCQELK